MIETNTHCNKQDANIITRLNHQYDLTVHSSTTEFGIMELQFLYTLSWSRVLYSTFDSSMLSGSEEDFYRNNAFHQLTIWQPQHKNPPLRVIKLTVLVHPPKLTITLYQYVLFVIMNIMNFLYMPYMAVPLPTNCCHRDQELYKLGRTILDHHYHKLSDNFI